MHGELEPDAAALCRDTGKRGMSRRTLNAVLTLVGAGLSALVLTKARLDLRPTVAVSLLLVAGLCLNLTGLLRRSFPLRPWLRVLAVLVALATLAGVGAVYCSLRQSFTELPARDVQLRESLEQAIRACWWLAAGLVYAGVAVVLLPRQSWAARRSQPVDLPDEPE